MNRPNDNPTGWNVAETGRLLRMIGPLVQIPFLWALTQRPQWASSHMSWVYGGFSCGILLVVAGLVMSLSGRKR